MTYTRPVPSPALRRFLVRLGLVVGGLALGVVAAEVAGRVAGLAEGGDLVFAAPQSYPRDLYVQDGDMRYPNPAFQGRVASFGYATEPRFSKWGVRGPDPQPGVPTWLGVGDSFTVALQVEEDETFLALAAAAAGAQPINAGVDGYSTWEAAIRVAQLGRHFPPSVVVLAFFTGNDFFDNERFQGTRTIANPGLGPGEPGAPAYPLAMQSAPPAPSAFGWLRDRSVLAAAWDVRERTRALRESGSNSAGRFRAELALFAAERPHEAEGRAPRSAAALQTFRDAVAAVGAKPVVVVIPPAFAMDRETAEKTFRSVGLDATPDLDRTQAVAVATVRRTGLPACDVMADLRAAAAAGDQPYLPFDGHLSPSGHAVVAAAIGRCLAGTGG